MKYLIYRLIFLITIILVLPIVSILKVARAFARAIILFFTITNDELDDVISGKNIGRSLWM